MRGQSKARGRNLNWRDPPGSERVLRILIVEDNPVNQKVVGRLMEKAGHTITLANNGREAVVAYGQSKFDLVLMDVQMPVMDGLSATATIRGLERESGRARVPIIALTAHAMAADRARCLQAGMDAHLAKPFKTEELLALVGHLTKAQFVDGPLSI